MPGAVPDFDNHLSRNGLLLLSRLGFPAVYALALLTVSLQDETLKQAYPALIDMLQPTYQQPVGKIAVLLGSLPIFEGLADPALPAGFYALGAKDAHAMVLGRYGWVSLNVTGICAQVAAVKLALPTLVGMVHYLPGNLHSD